ncbi:hypothetical protein ACSTS3_04640 [Aquimarina muelleri]|uniref:hypothetical protein n=1 Tax=Aquimarina muelleri TaxID=279356 RepID=UPI003F68584B
MNTYSIQTILLVIFITFTSCSHTAQEEKITHKISTTELPFKFEVISFNYQDRDSSYVHFYVPQEFSISNNHRNYIFLEDIYFSEKGGNIIDAITLNYKNGGFKTTMGNLKLDKKETRDFKIYTRFKRIISQKEIEELQIIFNQNFVEKNIYDKAFTSNLKEFLYNKIPIKGHTHFSLFNKKIKKRFFYNIPFEF